MRIAQKPFSHNVSHPLETGSPPGASSPNPAPVPYGISRRTPQIVRTVSTGKPRRTVHICKPGEQASPLSLLPSPLPVHCRHKTHEGDAQSRCQTSQLSQSTMIQFERLRGALDSCEVVLRDVLTVSELLGAGTGLNQIAEVAWARWALFGSCVEGLRNCTSLMLDRACSCFGERKGAR